MTKHPNHTRFSSRFSFKSVATAVVLAALTGVADAQLFNLPGVTNNRGWHQPGSRRNMVRFGTTLFAVVVLQDGRVQIRRKNDDTTSPWGGFVTVNNPATGIGSINPTTTVSMAVTSGGELHITWGRYHYSSTPKFFRQYYRCYRFGSGFTHVPQDITAYVGASSLTRSDSMAIAVGPKNFVYMSAQNGTQHWRSRLLQSAFVGAPTGLAPAWNNRGSIAANTASSQNVRMVVDSQSYLHMSFYNNLGNGQYATRVFHTPSTTWFAQDQIGVPPSPRDDDGYLASGWSGFTHVLYKHLVSTTGSVKNFELRYRRRLGTAAWSAPIVVDSFTSVDCGTDNPKSSYALAVGRRVFAIYRDYKCGRLMVKQKNFWATSFEFLSELRPPSTQLNDYYMPSVRSTLWPQVNGLYKHLDITFRHPGGGTFQLWHQRLEVSALNVDKVGCAGSCGVPAFTVSGVPCSTGPRLVEFGVENAKPGAPAYLLFTFSSTFAVPLACGTLYAGSILPPAVLVNPCCNAKKSYLLPPGGCSTWIYFQYAILDSGAVGGIALSNRGKMHL